MSPEPVNINNDSTPGVQVRLFGEPRLISDTGASVQVKSQKTASLLAYLFTFSHQHARERLVEFLWPDADPDTARARLRNVLADLRRVVAAAGADPDIVISATRTSIGINAAYALTDVARFERLVKEANERDAQASLDLLQDAVRASASEFCFTLYEDWATTERTRLLHLRHQALTRLGSNLLSLKRFDEAEETAHTLLREDPASEKAHIFVVAARIAAGDSAGARRQFAALSQMLKEEYGATPSDEANELIASIPATTEQIPQGSPAQGRLNGIVPDAMKNAPPSAFAASEIPGDSNVGTGARLDRRAMAALALVLSIAAVIATSSTIENYRSRHGHAAPPQGNGSGTREPDWVYSYIPDVDEKDSEPIALADAPDGALYVTGFVQTTHYDVDFLTVKLSADGKLLWRRRYNGTGNDLDRARSIAVAPDSSVYVTGESDNGRGNGRTRLAGLDIVTVKYDKLGNQIWENRLNGSADGDDRPVQILLTPAGNVVVFGKVMTRLPKGSAPISKSIVVEYDAGGKELWRRVLESDTAAEGTPAEMCVSLNVATAGSVLAVGQSISSGPTGREADILVTDIAANGHANWSKRYGAGNGGDDIPSGLLFPYRGDAITVIAKGIPIGAPSSSLPKLLVGKYTDSGEFIWMRSPVQVGERLDRILSMAGSADRRATVVATTIDSTGTLVYRLIRLSPDGAEEWARTVAEVPSRLAIPGKGYTEAKVVVGDGGDSYVTATVYGTSRADTASDILTAHFNAAGTLVWKYRYGALSDVEEPRALIFGSRAELYLAGRARRSWGDASMIILKFTR